MANNANANGIDNAGGGGGQGGRYRPNIPTPGKVDFNSQNMEDTWRKWRRQWESYLESSRLELEPPRYIVAVLLSTLGSEVLELEEGFQYGPGEDRHNPQDVLNQFGRYCVAETNEAYESYRFNKCDQAEGESIETYLARLRQLARGCNFGAMTDIMIRHRLVAGVREDTLRKKTVRRKGSHVENCCR